MTALTPVKVAKDKDKVYSIYKFINYINDDPHLSQRSQR